MAELEKGMVVQLKSGGPRMTVDKIDEHGISCVWFVDGEVKYNYFKQEALKISESE